MVLPACANSSLSIVGAEVLSGSGIFNLIELLLERRFKARRGYQGIWDGGVHAGIHDVLQGGLNDQPWSYLHHIIDLQDRFVRFPAGIDRPVGLTVARLRQPDRENVVCTAGQSRVVHSGADIVCNLIAVFAGRANLQEDAQAFFERGLADDIRATVAGPDAAVNAVHKVLGVVPYADAQLGVVGVTRILAGVVAGLDGVKHAVVVVQGDLRAARVGRVAGDAVEDRPRCVQTIGRSVIHSDGQGGGGEYRRPGLRNVRADAEGAREEGIGILQRIELGVVVV